MATIERRYYPAQELRVEGDGDKRTISWYPAVFNSLSEDLGGFRETINRRAFTKTLQEQDIRGLFNHDPNFVLGRNRAGTLDLKVDLVGLRASLTPPDTQWARDLMVSVERGDITAGSFGFRVIDQKWAEDAENGYTRELREVQLFDVSLVTYPAYPGTDGSVAMRSLLAGTNVDLEALTPLLVKARAGQPLAPEEREQFDEVLERLRSVVPSPEPELVTTVDTSWRARHLLLRKRQGGF